MFSNENQELNHNTSDTHFEIVFNRLITRSKEIYKLFFHQIIICLSILSSVILCSSYLLLTNCDSTFILNQKDFSHLSLIKQDIKGYNIYTLTSNNNQYTNSVSIIDIDMELYFQMYKFINNITTLNYFGKWNTLNYNLNIFKHHEGDVEIVFQKIKESNSNYTNTKLKMIFVLKDNKYIDRYIRGRIILNFDKEFMLHLDNALHKTESHNINLINHNTSLTVYSCLFLGKCKQILFNETLVNVTFIHKTKTIEEIFKGKYTFTFSEIYINIHDTNNNFTLNTHSNVDINKQFYINIRHYSFMLSFLTIIEIYYSAGLLYQIKRSIKNAQTINLFTILHSIITNFFLCTVHFYLSIISRDMFISLTFSIISLLYFIFLCFIEIHMYYYKLQATIYENNPLSFKRKLFITSALVFILIITLVIFSKELLTYFPICFFFYFMTWATQIVHSTWVGMRSVMNIGYIISLSLSKVYITLYIKCYGNNAFGLEPDYKCGLSLVSVVLFEMVVMLLQKFYGVKIIVPSFLREHSYNYYFNDCNEKSGVIKNNKCAICLCSMKEDKTVNNNIIQNNNNKLISVFNYLKEILNNKPFMITPCNHVFHSCCLEKWLEIKNECPYCKQTIPELE